MSDWIGIGIGMGYLQTGPFLDHLAVIKMYLNKKGKEKTRKNKKEEKR